MASVAYGQFLFALLFSAFWGSITVFTMLIQILKKGFGRFFHVATRTKPPECLQDPTLGTHSFARLKEVKLHYVANGEQGKPLMLFLHGFPENWYSWRHQLCEFSKDYRAVAVDMRGYGDSDKPSGVHSYCMEKLTGDIDELIPALGYDSCILVAHDWGGAVAWAFTTKYPKRVDKLIVCNIPHGGAFAKHIRKSTSQLLKSWYIFFFQLPFLPEILLRSDDLAFIEDAFRSKRMGAKKGISDEDVEAFKYYMSRPGALTPPINYYRATLRYKRMSVPSHEIKDTPVLCVWGTSDGALEKEMAVLSGKYVTDYTLRFIEGASHWVQQEEPELVNGYMREFLSGKKLE